MIWSADPMAKALPMTFKTILQRDMRAFYKQSRII